MARQRHPHLTRQLLELLAQGSGVRVPSVREAVQSANELRGGGFAVPQWEDLAAGLRPPQLEPHPAADSVEELGNYTRGWQRVACVERDAAKLESLLNLLKPTSRVLLLS